MASQLDFMSAARITGYMQGIVDPRLNPQPLMWKDRIPSVPAVDGEIMARFFGTLLMADLIATDAKAAVYSMGRFQYESTKIPKIKIGIGLNEELLLQLRRLGQQLLTGTDADAVTRQWMDAQNNARFGVELRIEQLKIAMLCDGLSYDKLGIKMSNVTWGMFSDLKITPTYGWNDPVNGTPVSDIFGANLVANARYGKGYNRGTFTTPAFRYMIATAEFQAKARQFLAPNVSYTNLSLSDLRQQKNIAQAVLAGPDGPAFIIEFDDRRVWTQDDTGTTTATPLQPVNKVILSNTADDGNTSVWDFANGEVMEAVVSEMVGPASGIGNWSGGTRGPAGYMSGAHDPAGINVYGVARGFPRKKQLQANACLTVGTFTDQLSPTVPFGS